MTQDSTKGLNNKQETKKATYAEGTNRINALGDFIKSASKIIWLVVILIIGINLWGTFSVNQIKSKTVVPPQTVSVTITEQKRPEISTDVALALGQALVSSKESATQNLNQWKNDAMKRVDHPFLDWYYDYFTQWGINLKAIFVKITSSSDEEKASKLIESFQKEFAKQVLQPQVMQLQMERFTREAIDDYVSEVEQNLSSVQSKYNVPQPDWERFLEDLGTITYNTGSEEQNLTLRTMSGGTAYLATGAMVKAVSVIGTKIATKAAIKGGSKAASAAATKIATKAATKIAAEGAGELTAGLVGLQLLNPIAGVGLLAWDIWDHYNTVKVERPILRENLEKYLNEVEDSLLNDRDTGILSSVYKFHDGIMDSIAYNLS